MRIFRNTEYGGDITIDEIRAYWDSMPDWEKEEHNNRFDNYLICCLTYNGGVLEEVRSKCVHNERKSFVM